MQRIAEDLRKPPAVRLVRGSQWVTLRLDITTDVVLLMTLVSLALRAPAPQMWPVPSDGPRAECNDHHSGALPREHMSQG
ncbi:DUF5519 family protein [Streptomyces sp. MBT33]|nr:DUF5519 family protein [Streptomyces sp. MBT33]